MFEVKVFDSSGNLKKVISEKALNKRSDKQINSPSLYRKGRKKLKTPAKIAKTSAKIN